MHIREKSFLRWRVGSALGGQRRTNTVEHKALKVLHTWGGESLWQEQNSTQMS